eukprot:SAG31_NODE_82_length_27046_cov_45.857275_3_plen_179_part_00
MVRRHVADWQHSTPLRVRSSGCSELRRQDRSHESFLRSGVIWKITGSGGSLLLRIYIVAPPQVCFFPVFYTMREAITTGAAPWDWYARGTASTALSKYWANCPSDLYNSWCVSLPPTSLHVDHLGNPSTLPNLVLPWQDDLGASTLCDVHCLSDALAHAVDCVCLVWLRVSTLLHSRF